MSTTNLNIHLWIRIYNGFAVIPDLRQTGIAKKTWPRLEKKIPVNFSVCPVNFFSKRIRFVPPLVFYNRSSNLQRNLKEIRKRAITILKITFVKILLF